MGMVLSGIRIKNYKDIYSGLFFLTVGVLGLIVSRDYPIGSAVNMNMGYLPRLLCWLLVILGLIIVGRGLVIFGEAIGNWAWRPKMLVVGSILAFGFTVERLGLIIASILAVVLGSYAGTDIRHKEIAVAAVLLAAGSAMVFSWFLGLPVNVWPVR